MKQKDEPRFGLDNRNTNYAVVPMAQDRQATMRWELDVRRQKAVAPKLGHKRQLQKTNGTGFACVAEFTRTVK